MKKNASRKSVEITLTVNSEVGIEISEVDIEMLAYFDENIVDDELEPANILLQISTDHGYKNVNNLMLYQGMDDMVIDLIKEQYDAGNVFNA